jgi:putative Holliday junction resolvase
MRILGIDYGTKRIGIALSDPDRQFALPHSVISNGLSFVQEIISLASTNDVKDIVIGESRNYNGEPNKILPQVLSLKSDLEASDFIVHLEPEFMTSQQAERFQGKNEYSDASAAALILQSYLDSHRNVK